MISNSIPIIKEKRLYKIIEALKCIDKHPFHRNKQKDCILALYPRKTEKSVFRGMIIPTTRRLGFIVGFGSSIRITCNGKLLILGENPNSILVRTVITELDYRLFKFIKIFLNSNLEIKKSELLNIFILKYENMSESQIKERVTAWSRILIECDLIQESDNNLKLIKNNLISAQQSLKILEKQDKFHEVLFSSYYTFPLQKTAGSVDISSLRRQVAITFWQKYNQIVTESQFDKLLSALPMVSDRYMITLGQSMGAEQQLFRYQRNYYRTLKIREFTEG